MHTTFPISLPDWTSEHIANGQPTFATDEERMRLVIGLARENVVRGTGGPFGAAVFDAGGRLIAPGVNGVLRCNCCVAHAEILAIALAQQSVGRYDLSGGGNDDTTLATSTEPCAMCLGAVVWSGVTRLVCGARDEDARAVGFDEGPKPSDWPQALEQRGIHVVRDVLRNEASDVLRNYAANGGEIYNPSRRRGVGER